MIERWLLGKAMLITAEIAAPGITNRPGTGDVYAAVSTAYHLVIERSAGSLRSAGNQPAAQAPKQPEPGYQQGNN